MPQTHSDFHQHWGFQELQEIDKILVTKCFHSTVDMAFFLVESVTVLTALLYTQYQVLPLYQKELGIFGLGAFKLLFYMTLQEKKNIVKMSYILQRCIVSKIKN